MALGALKGCLLLVLATALALQAYAVLSTSATSTPVLGVRGLRRLQMMRSSRVAHVEPLVRWLGVRLTSLLPTKFRRRLDQHLTLGGDFLGLSPEEFVAMSGLSAASACALGLAYSMLAGASGLFPPAAAALGAALPIIALLEARVERSRRVTLALPAVMDLLVLTLSAGLDFRGALNQVVEKSAQADHPLIEEIGFVLHELQMGKTRKAALTQLAARLPSQDLRDFVSTVIQAEEKGNPLARVLQIQAEVARQRRTVRAEDAAAKAGVKMMLPMLMVFAAILLMIATPMFLSLTATFG